MALSPTVAPPCRPSHCEAKPLDPRKEVMKQRLLRKGVIPTPKILHAIQKKELQKSLRKAKKHALKSQTPTLSDGQRQILEEEAHFRAAQAEYRALKKELEKRKEQALEMSGRPWEGSKVLDLRGIGSLDENLGEGRLKEEHLVELREMLEKRNDEAYKWLMDDDVEEGAGDEKPRERKPFSPRGLGGVEENIKWLVRSLNKMDLDMKDWKFSRLMRQSGVYFSEVLLLKILEGLGDLGNWKHALAVVEWVYNEKDYKYQKSRYVYTKLLSVLGKARRPSEALRIFKAMREDGQTYPDMAAYHAIAVILGQAGLVKDLINVIECMKQKPSKKIKNMKRKNWDPCLKPDIIVFNAVLNACIPSQQWKGVFWVLNQIRRASLEPNGATYGLAMEVMLKSRKYGFVHQFFGKMQRSGLATKALTYKVLVITFWEEGKVDEAIKAVRDMEQKGVVGSASVYYELACCLCNKGRWREAFMEVERLKRLPLSKPLEVTFTGMILSSMDGGYTNDCISIFEHMKHHCAPNIGTINAMLKVYERSDMFAQAKELFESIADNISGLENFVSTSSLQLDEYTYSSMLEISASAYQWEYFEYVYREMILRGYQLDPKKHSGLLVRASRAGKWHLLEHAFDMILEAGEIPHISLFIEMIFQTMSQRSFQRSVVLINNMAHASMQVSGDQWMSLFQRNTDRVNKDELLNLFNHLNKSDLVMEDPVPDFLKAVESLCRPPLMDTTSAQSVSSTNSTCRSLSDQKNEDGKVCQNILDYLSPRTVADINGNQEPAGETTISSPQGSNYAVESNIAVDNISKILDSILEENPDSSVTELEIDLLTYHDDGPCSDLPTSYEILEAWRKDQMRDGDFAF